MNGKRIRTIGLSGLALALLAACGSATGQQQGVAPTTPNASADAYQTSGQGVFTIKLPDGYNLMCVYARNYDSGGPSCDWPGHQAWKEARDQPR